MKEYYYEGEPCADGEYTLAQLSKPRHGRVYKPDSEELFNDMLVKMDKETFDQLFDYISGRDSSIKKFTAVVCDKEILHVYEKDDRQKN